MKYTASTKTNALFLASLKQAADAHCEDKELANRVMAHSLAFVEEYETGEQVAVQTDPTLADFKKYDAQIAKLFIQWGNALANGDGHAACLYSDQIDTVAADHPFTYEETKKFFDYNYSHSSYYSALQNYRKWDGSDQNFGLVKNHVSEDAKVAIIGDWGTGTEDAALLFKTMMEQHSPEVVLHLGDIYQAGMALEIAEYFTTPIKTVCEDLGMQQPPIFTIPGNHEYFSGAKDYFELLDVLNGGVHDGWNQEASFFCLRSKHNNWQFLGADTGLGCIDHRSSPRLEQSEVDWHHMRIKEFSGKTVMMTHHQLVSVVSNLSHAHQGHDDSFNYRHYNRHLVEYFSETNPNTGKPYFDDINLWLWGHDHHFTTMAANLEIEHYNANSGYPNPTLKRGQLLGGSAREVHGSGTALPGLSSWVQDDAQGNQIGPGSANSGLKNHTYAILDLATSTVECFQFPAWYDHDKSADKNPITTPLYSYVI